MTKPNTPVRIASKADQPNLSKGQKIFNMLVKKIEANRRLLLQWQEAILSYDRKVASDYMPAMRAFSALKAEMVRALDQALDQGGLTKGERVVVQTFICTAITALVMESGDDTLKPIYDKHSATSFDEDAADAVGSMKSVMETVFGFDLGDDADLASPDEVVAKLEQQMEAAHLRELEERDRRSQRKKSAKQQLREQQQQLEADQTSLSIREVYRKLASALHPDREPDAQERVRKTALMQRVNLAYEKKDLLQLLELQLELEQIDASAIANLSEHRLKHFNKILADQLAELEQEILHLRVPLNNRFGSSPYETLKPNQVIPRLLDDIAGLQHGVRKLKADISLPNDLVAFKRWIKLRRAEQREFEEQMRFERRFAF